MSIYKNLIIEIRNRRIKLKYVNIKMTFFLLFWYNFWRVTRIYEMSINSWNLLGEDSVRAHIFVGLSRVEAQN
jgi:hypothetical protein